MASLGSPKTWIPYVNKKDCSQGFCSVYCPQWCYVIFPPPPSFRLPEDNSGPNFSPLVIAIIGILVSAFLLVSYYTIISKYCGNDDTARRRANHDENVELEDNRDPSLHEPWHIVTTGLDEALIRTITVFKYKKGDTLIEGTDCSVCLAEFQDDECLRLLPKCSHAFHVACIDTWLRAHSNCPLCRANIILSGASLPPSPPPVTECPQRNESLQDSRQANENSAGTEDTEREIREEHIMQPDGTPKTPLRVFSDLGNLEERNTRNEIRDEGYQHSWRSVSMDHSSQAHTSFAEILRMNQDEVARVEGFSGDAGSSKHSAAGNKFSQQRRILHCVLSPVAMKRSFSSGRFFLTRNGRVRDLVSPV